MQESETNCKTAYFHLPGLFEFHELYREFLPVFYRRRDLFYPWAQIGSIYGAPADCLWAGGRLEEGSADVSSVLDLLREYGVSARLTFSNSLLKTEHLTDRKCNRLCRLLEETAASGSVPNGIIIHSDLLMEYLREHYPDLYLVSSTTKVITDFSEFRKELQREEFAYVVPDFRLNNRWDKLSLLTPEEKNKTEFLVNECCDVGCPDRRECYESVSRLTLDENAPEHICKAPGGQDGYRFSKAMKSPAFIGADLIRDRYLPGGFSQFKIEGRTLGSAVVFEMLLHYLAKPEHHLELREMIYLDSRLDLF